MWAVPPCEGQIEADAYITSFESPVGTVSVLNTVTNTVIGSPIAVGGLPTGVAVTPDGRFAYVTNQNDGTVSIIDASRAVLVPGSIAVGTFPVGVAVTPNNQFAYVANGNNSLSVINVTTNTVSATISTNVGIEPFGIAVTPNGQFAYVTNFGPASGNGTVSVVNTATNAVVGSPITVGANPTGVAVTPDGRFVYVANSVDNTVSVINTATNAVTGAIPVGILPAGLAITPDGRFVYVVNQGDGTVSVINTSTNAVFSIVVGNTPVGVAITPNGSFAYVTNEGSGTISVIETANNLVVQTINVVNSPASFGMFIGPNIIVANGGPLSVGSDAALTPLGFGQFVDFNGGTLKITGNFSSSRTISLLVGGGTIDTNGLNASLSGSIINSGSLTKIGAGVLTLSGDNTYTGGTNILGGVLSVSSDTNLGAGNVSIGNNAELLTTSPSFSSSKAISLETGGGTLAAAPGSVATYGGVISGIGGLTIGDAANTGTVVLSGDNTYNGATNVASGTLRAGSSAAFSANSAFTVGSVLDLNGFSNTVGSLSGTGTVTNNGGTAAVLTVGNANTNSTFDGTLANGNAVLGLTKVGAGALTLTGDNTYSGGTVINAGTLVVAGPQALGVGNLVVNGGTLTGGAQPVNVQGNYTQDAGGTLQLGVAGSAPGQYGFLNVGGHATLGGMLQLISLNGFQPRPSDQLTLVVAAGGLSGEFANVPDPFGPLLALNLIYRPNALLLEFSASFIPYAQTPNERAAASLVDSIQFNPKAAQLISFLLNQPLANLPNDLAQISPDALTAFYEISFSNANIQRLTLEGRLDDLRSGSSGFSSNMKLNGAAVNLEDKATVDSKSSKSPVEQALQPEAENRWGVWVTGFGDFVNVDGDHNANGYDFTTGGFSVGVDYRVTDQLAIGAMGEYAHTWTSLKPSGDIDVDSGRGGVYATWFSHGIYVNAATYGGHNVYSSSRPTLGGMATGGTGGAEYSAFISGGYDFHCGHLSIGPIAALQYTYVNIDSYSEKGSLAPLDIHAQSAESLRSDFGLRASYLWQLGKVLVEPALRAAWEHEYKYSALPMTTGFAGIPGPSNTFYGPSEGHDSAIVSVGVSVHWTPTIATDVNYDGQLGRDRYESNAVTGGVRISF